MKRLESISTEPLIKELRNLRESIPNQIDNFYMFAECIAQRLECYHNTSPELFCATIIGGLFDISQNTYEEGVPILNREFPLSDTERVYLRARVPEIINKVCPRDFATKIIWTE